MNPNQPSNQPPNREKDIFQQALEIQSDPERAQFLAQTCGSDAALRRRVENLLKAHRQAGNFIPEKGDTLEAGQPVPTLDDTDLPGRLAEIIGPYKLLQKIGEGGCGIVYMAEQEEPIRRRVALKVIKAGMDTKSVIARFEAERQALALMDHPNIARVFDAGSTATGRPYFVMELVRGIPITDYCNQAQLSLPERLKLYVQVCQGIQHAHQKGVIHRDIKPSNVLVTLYDSVAVPKIIDFGIAKATQQPLTEKTLFTAFDQFMGTPAYMSPEQAALSALDVDTRSDVYALGVLLYELLTGKTPLDPRRLLNAGLDEMRRVIREEDPSPPSTCVGTMVAADLLETARQRQLDPSRLKKFLHGDLDWIVMKAMEKQRSHRYESADGLALDVQRFLMEETVLARPPSTVYRLQKMVRRNRTAFAIAGAVCLTLVVVTIFGLIKILPVLADRPELRGRPLPWLMQVVIDLSHFLSRNGLWLFVLGAGIPYLFWKLRRRKMVAAG